MRLTYSVGVLILCLSFSVSAASGQGSPPGAEPEQPKPSNESSALFQSFSESLTNVVFVGHFTIDGSSQQRKEERYEIHRVVKTPKGDYWLFQARIEYGKYDVSLPLPLEVKWAGKTPVITLDDVTIPTLGTFSARVVIDGKRYAGTWTHGEVGGHMFGKIEKKTKSHAANEEK